MNRIGVTTAVAMFGVLVGAALGGAARPAGPVTLLENLPVIGTSAGRDFRLGCPEGSVVTGIRYRRGLVVDGIGLMCSVIGSTGRLQASVAHGSMAGSNAGTAGRLTCDSEQVVAGQRGSAQIGVSLANFELHCYQWFQQSRSWGGSARKTLRVIGNGGGTTSTCSLGAQPIVGMRGRHGSFVDAVGMFCD